MGEKPAPLTGPVFLVAGTLSLLFAAFSAFVLITAPRDATLPQPARGSTASVTSSAGGTQPGAADAVAPLVPDEASVPIGVPIGFGVIGVAFALTGLVMIRDRRNEATWRARDERR